MSYFMSFKYAFILIYIYLSVVDLMMMSDAQNIQWQMVQWLVCNAIEGMLTEPVMVKYLLQYPHLSTWS
jgi:hypothetical protein